MPDTVLQKLDRCAVLLAECRTAQQAKRVADLSEAARVYAKRVGASRDVVNQAAEYKLRAERRLGEILATTEKARAGRPKIGSGEEPISRGAPTLAQIEISKKLSSRAQKLAAVPVDVFEVKIAETKDDKKDLCFSTFADRAEREMMHKMKLTQPLPKVKYRVIYADPPWRYRDSGLDDYGHYNSVRHEVLLTYTRGSMLPEHGKLYDSVVVIERSKRHSEKPEKFREIIEAMYPSGPRIELFARKPSPGWAIWGNENG